MILATLLLLLPSQEIGIADTVQRDLRLHSVSGLVREAGYLISPGLYRSLELGPTDASAQWQRQVSAYLLQWHMNPIPSQPLPTETGKFESVQELEEIASRFCQPPLDPKFERMQADDQGWLVCYLRPEQHEWLARFIELQEVGARDWIANVETHWFTLSNAEVGKLKLSGSALLMDDAAQAEQWLARLKAASGQYLVAPKVSAFPGQHAEISTLNQISYVKEYKLEIVEPGRQEIADPVVDVIQEGQSMTLRVLQAGDQLYGLRLSCSSAQLERPIPRRRFKLSPAHPNEVEVAMPQLRTAQVDATVLVEDGGGVLLTASGLEDGKSLVIFIRFQRVSAGEVEKAAR